MATQTNNILILPLSGADAGVTRTIDTSSDSLAIGVNLELTGTSSLTIGGDLTVTGTKTINSTETILVADNHTYMNAGYTTAAAETGGLVVNYLPTATATTTAAAGVFVAGVDAASDPTVTTAGSATFAAADLIQISGSANGGENDGLYEVQGHAGNTLTIKSTADGVTNQVEDFTDGQFVANAGDTGAAITKVTVSVLRAGTDGIWETGSGAVTGISFSNLATAAGADLQSAYDAGQTITLVDTSGDMVITLDDSGTAADLQITDSGGDYLFTDAANNQIVLGSSANDVNVPDDTQLEVGTGADFAILHNGTDTTITSQTGDLVIDNTLVTGSTINRLGTDDLNTDFQIQNDSASALFTVDGGGQADFAGNLDANAGLDVIGGSFTHASGGTGDVDVSWDFSGGLVNSAGELLVSGGNMQLNDSIVFSLGTGDDFTISHDGTNTVFDNTFVTGATVFQLGTDTLDTELRILNNSGTELFGVDGAGSAVLAATMVGDSLAITESSVAKTGASLDITWTAVAATTAKGVHIDWSPMTTLTSGTDQYGLDLDGETNAGAGNSVAISIDSAWDVGIENESSMRMGEISDPVFAADKGFVYVKDDSGDTELYYMDDGGAVVQLTKDGELNVSVTAVTETFTTDGTGVTAGDAVYVNSSGTVGAADANGSSSRFVIGFAKTTVGAAQSVEVQMLQGGIYTCKTDLSALSGTPATGDVVYLDDTTPGGLVVVAPTSSGTDIFRVGWIKDLATDLVVFSPQFVGTVP
jgi:hypothetical protein